MALNSTKVIIADLQTKYEQLQRNDSDLSFYTKLADYGRYLIEQEQIQNVVVGLKEDAKKDIKRYKNAAEEYLHKWNELAKDLVDMAEKEGLKDDPKDPFQYSITLIKDRLGNKEVSGYDKYIDQYNLHYSLLLDRIRKEGKENLLIPKHIEKGNNYSFLQSHYQEVDMEWEGYKTRRENSVWWAHYQIERLTHGVYKLNGSEYYFPNDDVIAEMYLYEFNLIASGRGSSYVILKRYKFEMWLELLHKYLIPRLEALQDTEGVEVESTLPSILQYFSAENIVLFKAIQYKPIGKAKALLIFLNRHKGIPITLEEIKEGCNGSLPDRTKFKTQKDLSDTLRTIRTNLNVKSREYFPIEKVGDKIIWLN